MSEIDEIWDELEYAEHGKARMELCKRGWELADKIQDYDNQIEFRMEYMSEVVFYDDDMLIYIVFPEILKLYDEHIKQVGEDSHTWRILWNYKWILAGAMDFYQISKSQFEAFKEDFKRRYLANGYSLRSYYQNSYYFYMRSDWEKAEEAYRLFLECERDSLSDCHACERDLQVEYLLTTGQEEEALRQAEDLFERRLSCKEVPEITYGKMLRFYNFKTCEGNNDSRMEAELYCRRILMSINYKKIGQDYIGDIFLYFSLNNPETALAFYKKYWSFFEENKNPTQKIYFAMGAVKLFQNMQNKETFRMKMDQDFPLYEESGTYSIKMLREHYEKQALNCIKRLDERNQSTFYADKWKTVIGE